jgi:hypothetical protein
MEGINIFNGPGLEVSYHINLFQAGIHVNFLCPSLIINSRRFDFFFPPYLFDLSAQTTAAAQRRGGQ